MAGELIGALRVALGFDTAEFTAGTKKARAEAKATATSIQAELSGLKAGVTALATGAVATAVFAAGKAALDYASSLGEVSQQLGVTSKDLQVYRYAASQVGVSQDEMDAGLAKLTKSIGEADAGAKVQATTFRDLGISVRDVNGNVRTAGEIMPKLADALAQIKDPATRARIETELFGKAGQKLDTLLAGGSSAIDELRKAAADLGLVLSDDQIQNADKAADKLSEVKQVLEARIAGIVADNAGAIFQLADAFEALVGPVDDAVASLKRFSASRSADLTPSISGQPAAPGFIQRLQTAAEGFVRDQFTTDDMKSEAAFSDFNAKMNRLFKMPSKAATADGALPAVKGDAEKAAKEAERLQQEALRREDRYQSELARNQSEYLGLREQLTTDAREQAKYQHQVVEDEAGARKRDLDLAVQEKQLTAAAAAELERRGEINDQLKHAAINRELDAKLDQEDLNSRLAGMDNQRDLLGAQEALAKTAGERRDIELKLLDIQYQEERARLDAVLASKDASEAEKEIALRRLAILDDLQGAAAENIRQNTRGAGGDYLASIYKTAGERAEDFQRTAVDGLRSLDDQLTETATKVLKLGGVFGNVANSIISDLVRIGIQQNITGPLATKLFGVGGSGGGLLGSLLGGSANNLSAATNGAQIGTGSIANLSSLLPGLATGGTIGGFPGIDRNVLSLNGMPVARVGRGEMLRIEPNNDNGARGAIHFDLRGAVMTQDLLNQMNAIGQASAVGGANMAQTDAARRGRRRISR
jgi:hypothetical protein